MMVRVLLADDEINIIKVLQETLKRAGFLVDIAVDGDEAISKVQNSLYDVALIDLRMPGKNGIQVLQTIKERRSDTIVILMTAYGTIGNAVEAMKLGAYDYLTKPFENEEVVKSINQALKAKAVAESGGFKEGNNSTFIIGNSMAMQRVMNVLDRIKNFDSTVLITGESGTGKSLIAKALHAMGKRKNLPFVHINCASLPVNLIESELFGYEKGAFTGAVNAKPGKFEIAGKGTIFLDEISTLALDLQAKLLTVLEERKVERIGSTRSKKMSARIVAATNTNLEEAVKNRQFRDDLYYRLNVITLHVPPLRERKEDIGLLIEYFLKIYQEKFNKNKITFQPEVYDALRYYNWPGNIRELENAIESVVALAVEDTVNLEDLPVRIKRNYSLTGDASIKQGNYLNAKDQEGIIIIEALRRNFGHREKTAKELGISRRTLQYKLKKLKIT